ncbi:MAG: acyl-CoA thioesterase II [Proteobacteria bacterium]|nr:MAG: acyl-CoA thioesterase II [Pseudomonadota bacterium]PIE40470.1 MAG: acyl-CoA thioesterase II [Gammaproteobacteria bacterium]
MSEIIQELVELLNLETIEHNLFRGQSQDIGSHSVFGGQVISQALVAAARTLDNDRHTHSLHAYFLRPGDMEAPIVYKVDRIRNGGSFTTRRVVAVQHGEAIFSMSCSFQTLEDGLEHQAVDMPNVPAPADVEPESELIKRVVHKIPERIRDTLTRECPIEIRPVNPVDFFTPEKTSPRKQVWFKTNGKLNDSQPLHQALLAYASDFGLIGTGMMPHGLSFCNPALQVASLDHAIWFHHPFRADDWLLYDMESPSASNARNFNRGLIYNQAGQLVASVAQEGLMRIRKKRG